MKQLERPCSVS